MSKASGPTRMVKPTYKALRLAYSEYLKEMSSQDVDTSNSYFSKKTGASVIFMKGHSYNPKDPNNVAEIEAAIAAADNGISVKLTPEGAGYEMYATHKGKDKHGNDVYKFADGVMATYTYEQRTPTIIKDAAKNSIRQAIMHANSKHAQIALIYDKYGLFHHNDIKEGMKYYQSKFHMWKEKGVKAVVVINSQKELYEHHFEE